MNMSWIDDVKLWVSSLTGPRSYSLTSNNCKLYSVHPALDKAFVYKLWLMILRFMLFGLTFLTCSLGIAEALWFNVVACFQLHCPQTQQRLYFITSTLIISTPETTETRKPWIFNECDTKAGNKSVFFFLPIAQWLFETLFTQPCTDAGEVSFRCTQSLFSMSWINGVKGTTFYSEGTNDACSSPDNTTK